MKKFCAAGVREKATMNFPWNDPGFSKPTARRHARAAESRSHQNACPESAVQSATFLSSHRTELKSPESPPDRPSQCRYPQGTSRADHSTSRLIERPPSDWSG